jgi:hypothetical protein
MRDACAKSAKDIDAAVETLRKVFKRNVMYGFV